MPHPTQLPAAGDLENLPDEQACPVGQELLAAERRAALREAFSRLPPDGQQLIAMLITEPPVPYTEISARLGIPVGSTGPKRSRCLDKHAVIRPSSRSSTPPTADKTLKSPTDRDNKNILT